MTNMRVYSMSDLYKSADKYAEDGEVQYIEIGVCEDGEVLVCVGYRKDKKDLLGSFRITYKEELKDESWRFR